MSINSAKAVLRKEIKKELTQLSEVEKLTQSESIVKKLLKHPFYIKAERISVYLHMKNEVKTTQILEDAFLLKKKVYIPKYYNSSMDMVKLDSLDDYFQLPETSWHIKQPADTDFSRENALETGGLDLIIVPGVAFTVSGHRLGHGKGYYDSYIRKISKNFSPYLIGLAFNVQIRDKVPITNTDMPLNEIITFSGVENVIMV